MKKQEQKPPTSLNAMTPPTHAIAAASGVLDALHWMLRLGTQAAVWAIAGRWAITGEFPFHWPF